MDRFSELNAFIAVVEAGGFSAAARRRGEGQPAVSKAIAALEKRLGVALFNRSTRSVTLTDQGQRYYDRTKPLVDEMDDVDNEMTNSTLSVTGLVRISVASTFGRLHILPARSRAVIGLSRSRGRSHPLGFRARHGGGSDRSRDPAWPHR